MTQSSSQHILNTNTVHVLYRVIFSCHVSDTRDRAWFWRSKSSSRPHSDHLMACRVLTTSHQTPTSYAEAQILSANLQTPTGYVVDIVLGIHHQVPSSSVVDWVLRMNHMPPYVTFNCSRSDGYGALMIGPWSFTRPCLFLFSSSGAFTCLFTTWLRSMVRILSLGSECRRAVGYGGYFLTVLLFGRQTNRRAKHR